MVKLNIFFCKYKEGMAYINILMLIMYIDTAYAKVFVLKGFS